MRNLLLFIDGAVHAAIWATGPLLLPSLIISHHHDDHDHDIHNGNNDIIETDVIMSMVRSRPSSAEDALKIPDKQRGEMITSTTGAMVTVLLVFLAGRAMGCYFMDKDKRYGQSLMSLFSRARLALFALRSRLLLPSSTTATRSLPSSASPSASASSWRMACFIVSMLASLLLLSWGLGIFTFGGWIATRFVTAFVSGGIMTMTWGKQKQKHSNHSHNITEFGMEQEEEEAQTVSLLMSASSLSGGEENDDPRSASTPALAFSPQSQSLEKNHWLDCYWLAGVGTSSLLGGLAFYPLNRLMVAFHPHERIYVLGLIIGIGVVGDRCLCLFQYCTKYKHKNKNKYGPSALGGTSSASPSFSDAGMVGIADGNDNDNGINISRSSSVSTIQRRKGRPSQQQQQQQPHSLMQSSSMFDEEQQITFHDHHHPIDASQLQRLDSNDTMESEQFFDCLDDIELDSEHNIAEGVAVAVTATAQTPTHTPTTTQSQSYEKNVYQNQIAIYSGRKVIYPDGSPAIVPAGESLSNTPPGYSALYKNNPSKARAMYQLTQQWRQKEQIRSIHARPHPWFPKIKSAYPHVIHGFTPNGMPVVYESPGRMNLKELFRNGCHVENMIFHYCYLMEYLSNLESILTELHSDDDHDNENSEWQDELASYAHAKQNRLQGDPIPFGFCVVMDISGATPTSLSGDVMTYLKRAGDVNSSHYPGSMRRAVAVQAPFWIGVAWKAMKGVMPASVTVDLLSGTQTMEGGLSKYIDEDQIPAEYGGKSRFKFGEHPFEVGLRKLVERQNQNQEEAVDDLELGAACIEGNEHSLETPPSVAVSPLQASTSTPLYISPGLQLERKVILKQDSHNPTSSTEQSTKTWEWDGLDANQVLAVTSALHFFLFIVVGSLELALPYWMISPPINGGMGYEARRIGMVIFSSCAFNMWAINRSRFFQLIRSTIEKAPLRGFRIGMGTACFVLICVSLTPVTSNPNKSTVVFLCFSAYLSLVSFGLTLGILSLQHVRGIVNKSSDVAFGWMQNSKLALAVSIFGRAIGYVCIAPIFRWSIQKDLSFPFNASFFLCLLACICWLLYIISFSLHTAAPPPRISLAKRKESQLMSAMTGWVLFTKEVLLVAFADIGFLANTLK